MIDIDAYAKKLAANIKKTKPSPSIKNESEFEVKHVNKSAWELVRKHPEITVCLHPSKKRETCRGSCAENKLEFKDRVAGCPTCWRNSKEWSVVKAYGLKHNFDVVARDYQGKTLAVEVKWLKFRTGRRPNGEFQRFIGQCTLAAARHDVVLGICGIKGDCNKDFDQHTKAVNKTLQEIGVTLVVLYAR